MDETFINAALKTYGDTVLRAASSIVCNKADAEDVFSEVFFELYKRQESFSSDQHLKAWLIKVAVNRAKNIRSSAWFKKRVSLDDTLTSPQIEGHDEVTDALKELKSGERIVVYLHYYEGYSLCEIAKVLGIREGSVRSRASRARQKLKELLIDSDI